MSRSDAVRTPRVVALANGSAMPGLVDARIVLSAGYSAGRFHVTFAGDVGATALLDQPEIDIAVMAAVSPWEEFAPLVEGIVDSVVFDPATGIVHLEGRDRTALLIEARTSETFANRTASEIATIIAARRGLAALVTPTATPVGRYWQLGHDSVTLDRFSHATTEWDLLAALAGWEGFDVWVEGRTLNFRAPASDAVPLTLRAAADAFGPADVTALRCERALTLAGGVSVSVRSWHSRLGRLCTAVAEMGSGARASRSYVFTAPNLTPEMAQQLADRRLADVMAHAWVVEAEMPGETAIAPRALVSLLGTESVFDRDYRVTEIERRFNPYEGFAQTVRMQGLA